jgi:hypothetical protein
MVSRIKLTTFWIFDFRESEKSIIANPVMPAKMLKVTVIIGQTQNKQHSKQQQILIFAQHILLKIAQQIKLNIVQHILLNLLRELKVRFL